MSLNRRGGSRAGSWAVHVSPDCRYKTNDSQGVLDLCMQRVHKWPDVFCTAGTLRLAWVRSGLLGVSWVLSRDPTGVTTSSGVVTHSLRLQHALKDPLFCLLLQSTLSPLSQQWHLFQDKECRWVP